MNDRARLRVLGIVPLLGLVVAVAAVARGAQGSPSAAPAQPAPPVTPSAVTLADFAWLAGTWTERGEGSVSEESWQAPLGDVMIGTWRLVVGGRAKVLELLELRQEGEAVVFRLRHFDGALVGWEEKDAPIELAASAPEPGVAVFAGTGSDGKPLRISYRRTADGYHGLLEHGEDRQEFHFRRGAAS
jgi:hypothetical protein